MGKAFISYSHKDIETVAEVNRRLSEAHVLTWFDKKSISPGDQWEINIATSIFSCDVFIMFYSKNYRDSEYCRKEYELYGQKKTPTPLIVVGLDDARDSFHTYGTTGYQFIDYDYVNDSVEVLTEKLLANAHIRHCKLLEEDSAATGEGTDFLNALKNLQHPKHYNVLEPLIRFLLFLEKQEKSGKYISENANFSSLTAQPLINKTFSLTLRGEDDFCSERNDGVRNNFIRNVFYALFKFGRVEFSRPAPENLEFDSLFLSAPCHFLRPESAGVIPEIYADFNEKLSALYRDIPQTGTFISRLNEIYEADKFLEGQELRFYNEKQPEYEVNSLTLQIAKRLYAASCDAKYHAKETCVPLLTFESGAPFSLSTLYEDSLNSAVLRGDYGSGKTYLLKKWHEEREEALYVDVTSPSAAHAANIVQTVLEGQEYACYRLQYAGLHRYSSCIRRVTLLIDNVDLLSQDKRKRVLSEVVRLSGVFRIVLTTSKHNLEEKISLNLDGDSLSGFDRATVLPLRKEQIIAYLEFRLFEKGGECANALTSLRSLPEDSTFFGIFNGFTKLDVLLASVPDWESVTAEKLNAEFNSRIRVYRNIFESDYDYSIPRKIASLFRETLVDIQDVILRLVADEIEILKEESYRGYETGTLAVSGEERIRFRDFYPVLTRIMGKYSFLNEDMRAYFAASYVRSRIQKGMDYADVEQLLAPIKNNYLVLKYLGELGVLSLLDLEYLLQEESSREGLILTLYKVLQYETNQDVRMEFLQHAAFTALPDKFFMGAENVRKVVVPPSVRTVGRAVFANMPLLQEINFAPKGLPTVGELTIKPWAILNCPKLKTIVLGKNYLKYRHPLFSRCFALSEIVIDERNPALRTLSGGQMIVSKDGGVLYTATNSLNGELCVPESVYELAGNALSYLKNVTKVVIPKTVTEIATNFSDFCDNLQFFSVEEGNPVYASDEHGLMFTQTENGKTLFRAPSGIREELRIPDGVEVIGSDSISCCIWVKDIFVPQSVRVIENYAFADTYSLERLVFERIDNVEEFGDYIFLSTKETAHVYGEDEYSLKAFHTAFCRPKGSHKLRGAVRRPITCEAFTRQGFELLNPGRIPESVANAVIARDITLFNTAVYRAQDFNILLIGLTEYNAILTKTPLEAETYLSELITKNNISMVILSRDLPNLTQFETLPAYKNLTVMRTAKSSTKATALLAEIIRELGEER